MQESGDRVRAMFGPNYDRLARIKGHYDPVMLVVFVVELRDTAVHVTASPRSAGLMRRVERPQSVTDAGLPFD